MVDDLWMTRLLDDARDRALSASRAKLHHQARQLRAADQEIAELGEQCASLRAQLRAAEQRAEACARRARDAELEIERLVHDLAELALGFEELDHGFAAVYDELLAARGAITRLRVEYAQAAIRERTLEARIAGLLGRLFGEAGLEALDELLAREGTTAAERPTLAQRRICEQLGAMLPPR